MSRLLHCVILMFSQFREMGLADAVDPDNKSTIYWTQVYATPR